MGKTASAWTSFKEAAEIAAQRNDPRAERIQARLATLEPALSNLVIEVADSEPTTLEVRHDGVLVGRAAWRTPIPIDPGEHAVTATAKGARPRELRVTIPQDGQTITVRLPPIEYLPAPAAAAKPVAARRPASPQVDSRPWLTRHRKLVAGVLGGVGVAGLGVGTAFGLMVKSTYDKSAPHCNGDHCDATGHDYRQSAFDKALVADLAFGVGAAALVGGTVLWFTAPKQHGAEQAETTNVAPVVGPNVALVSVRRRW